MSDFHGPSSSEWVSCDPSSSKWVSYDPSSSQWASAQASSASLGSAQQYMSSNSMRSASNGEYDTYNQSEQHKNQANIAFRPPSPTPCFDGFPSAPQFQVEQPRDFRQSFACSNYLRMIAQQIAPASAPDGFEPAADLYSGEQEAVDYPDDGSYYLTSPHMPFDRGTGASNTPMDTPLHTPLLQNMPELEEQALFGGPESAAGYATEAAPASKQLPLDTSKLWTFSPSTPALDTFDPVVPTSRPVIPPPPQWRAPAAGAPQKRAHSVQIEYKRRLNTFAARRSRRRKAEHQRMLEEKARSLRAQLAMWTERAKMAEDMLRSRGVNVNFSGEE
ncbi:hypothetical protein B0H14DRAFT_2708080 [Mycena olivaceomarginata]|nr:hypothetical protein B0H14DRAFT_2708080 [Mycena olivaceomarginata]